MVDRDPHGCPPLLSPPSSSPHEGTGPLSANRPRHRRITCIAGAVAVVTLTAGLATACGPDDFDHSLDCVSDADTISDSLKAIHEAGWDAAKDPSRTDESIDTIEKNLDKINDDTDDSEVDRAADELNQAIEDYNKAVLNGDTDPDTGRIDAAADKLKDVCTS